MKKLIMLIVLCASAMSMQAQKFALVDMEYILKNIPAYERAIISRTTRRPSRRPPENDTTSA